MSLPARCFRSLIRCGLTLVLAAGLLPAVASAQQDEAPRPQLLRSATDGSPIYITYYPALEDRNPRGVANAGVVVLLHDADGYKLTEIQELTGTPVGTLKSRLHRARARLRDLLGATDGTLPGGTACTGTETDD